MKRDITLSEDTKLLFNAILDLEQMSGQVYDYIKKEFSEGSGNPDEVGQDVLTATTTLRGVLQHYLEDRLNTNFMLTKNQNGTSVAI